MAQRSDQLSRSRTDTAERTTDRSLGERATDVFSPKFFVLALIAFGVALTFGNAVIPFVPVVPGLVAVFAIAFVLGAVSSTRRYLEVGVAGALASGLLTFLGHLFISVLGNVGVPIAVAGGIGGLLASLVGYYFGRDLRDGLTREL